MSIHFRLDPRWPLCLLAAVFAVLMLRASQTPLLDPDSTSYINWSPLRTMGYPMVIRLLGVQVTVLAQPLIYAAATLTLCFQLLRKPGMGGWALLLEIALLSNPELNKYHAFVMTESLFMSLSILWLVAALSYFRRPSWQAILAASVLAGLMAWLRPTAYMMPPVLVGMVLLTRASLRPGQWKKMLLLAVMPMLLMVAAERGIWHAVQGPDAQTLAGRHFFAKAGMINSPEDDVLSYPDDPVRQRLQTALTSDFAPVRDLMRQATASNIHNVLQGNYEICLEYACSVPFRSDIPLPETEMNKILFKMAIKRIASAPVGYLHLTLDSYLYMWELYSQNHPNLLPGFNAFISQHRPLPFEQQVASLLVEAQPSRAAIVGRPAIIAMGWLTGLLALAGIAALWRGRVRSESLAIAMTAAVVTHAGLWFTAMVGIGCPRYTIGFWPTMILSAVAFGAWGLEKLRGRPLGR